jgi:hypothetical protein
VIWDVHGITVVIELRHDQYNELIVEVADPKAAVELVKNALRRSEPAQRVGAPF